MNATAQQGRAASDDPALFIARLPAFPPVALKVLQLVSSESVRLPELSRLISADPALASQILALANSPLCGFRHEIASLPQAMTLLGLERVKGLAITVGLQAFLKPQVGADGIRMCWRHSLACALMAERIAPQLMVDKDVCYAAGILHDIGRLAMAVLWPERYCKFLADAERRPADVLLGEREAFGIDHCEVGTALVSAWNLPPEFHEITAHHHDATSIRASALLQVAQISCRLADAIGFPALNSLARPDYEVLLQGSKGSMRDPFLSDQKATSLWLAETINAIELT